jgi:hypothetical protein
LANQVKLRDSPLSQKKREKKKRKKEKERKGTGPSSAP